MFSSSKRWASRRTAKCWASSFRPAFVLSLLSGLSLRESGCLWKCLSVRAGIEEPAMAFFLASLTFLVVVVMVLFPLWMAGRGGEQEIGRTRLGRMEKAEKGGQAWLE